MCFGKSARQQLGPNNQLGTEKFPLPCAPTGETERHSGINKWQPFEFTVTGQMRSRNDGSALIVTHAAEHGIWPEHSDAAVLPRQQ